MNFLKNNGFYKLKNQHFEKSNLQRRFLYPSTKPGFSFPSHQRA